MLNDILVLVIILIATSVFIVVISQKLNLSPVLGYLISGALLGSNGWDIVSHKITEHFGEFGVVFLLFVIGLELSINRLNSMRKYVFGLGSLQVILTFCIIFFISKFLNINNTQSIIIAGGLSLSSTAIVMQSIFEQRIQSLQIGRISISILLLQDLAAIPLLVIVPFLSSTADLISNINVLDDYVKTIFINTSIILGVILAGRVFLRPLFNFIVPNDSNDSELAIALTFLIVLFSAWGTEIIGLSYALGGFISGVLVAETDFRNKAAKSIEPFKNLLLGLFFMSVGMKINILNIYEQLYVILIVCILLIILKTTIITGICLLFKLHYTTAIRAGLLLSQGGEFGFIIFNIGSDNNLLSDSLSNILLPVITGSMAITPLLSMLGNKLVERFEFYSDNTPIQKIRKGTSDLKNHIIVAGFGKVGKLITNVLDTENINNYAILDIKHSIINKEKEKTGSLFQGDILQYNILQAIGIDRASILVITVKNEITIRKCLNLIYNKFPNLKIVVKLKDLTKSADFYKIGANVIIPQNYEMGLQLGTATLRLLGISDYEINRVKKHFRDTDYVGNKEDNNILNLES